MRQFLAAVALIVPAAAALAQNAANQTPTKSSLPTGHIYTGGFQRPIFQGGFPRIMPFGFPQIGRESGPRTSQVDLPSLIDDPEQIRSIQAAEPQVDASHAAPSSSVPDVRVNRPAASVTDADHHEHDHSKCTGNCGDHGQDQDHGQPDIVTAARQGDEAAKRARAEGAAKIASGNNSYCMKCHPDGIPVERSKRPRDTRDFADRVKVGDPDSVREGLGKVVSDRPVGPIVSVEDPCSRQRHERSGEQGMGAAPDMRLQVTGDPETAGHQSGPTQDDDESTGAFTRPQLVGSSPAIAADQLRSHLRRHPDDFAAQRLLAVALLNSKHPQDAATVLAKAYDADPLLSKEPLDTKALGLDSARVNNLAGNAATAAKQANTPQAWLLATVLYQAQNAKPQALAALDNATKQGLNSSLSDWMSAELNKAQAKAGKTAEAQKVAGAQK